MAASPFAPSMRVEKLIALLQHADEMAEYGSAHGTLRKDEVAYRHWVFFAQEMGFDPLLTSPRASTPSSPSIASDHARGLRQPGLVQGAEHGGAACLRDHAQPLPQLLEHEGRGDD